MAEHDEENVLSNIDFNVDATVGYAGYVGDKSYEHNLEFPETNSYFSTAYSVAENSMAKSIVEEVDRTDFTYNLFYNEGTKDAYDIFIGIKKRDTFDNGHTFKTEIYDKKGKIKYQQKFASKDYVFMILFKPIKNDFLIFQTRYNIFKRRYDAIKISGKPKEEIITVPELNGSEWRSIVTSEILYKQRFLKPNLYKKTIYEDPNLKWANIIYIDIYDCLMERFEDETLVNEICNLIFNSKSTPFNDGFNERGEQEKWKKVSKNE